MPNEDRTNCEESMGSSPQLTKTAAQTRAELEKMRDRLNDMLGPETPKAPGGFKKKLLGVFELAAEKVHGVSRALDNAGERKLEKLAAEKAMEDYLKCEREKIEKAVKGC